MKGRPFILPVIKITDNSFGKVVEPPGLHLHSVVPNGYLCVDEPSVTEIPFN